MISKPTKGAEDWRISFACCCLICGTALFCYKMPFWCFFAEFVCFFFFVYACRLIHSFASCRHIISVTSGNLLLVKNNFSNYEGNEGWCCMHSLVIAFWISHHFTLTKYRSPILVFPSLRRLMELVGMSNGWMVYIVFFSLLSTC